VLTSGLASLIVRSMTSSNAIAIAVHGGAGWIRDELTDVARSGCARAADAGWAVLCRGGSAVDAVAAAVVVLEDDPFFNAGRGSVLTRGGEVEMDALIVDGGECTV